MFITECPRDAIQGWPKMVPTDKKIDYMNALMEVGYDILDCASFVHPKLVPQMADSGAVVDAIDKSRSKTKLSVVVANYRGAEKAMEHPKVDFIGFPFSISETFQHRNTNKSREEAFMQIEEMLKLVQDKNRKLILYFSMAFGNPYGEGWSVDEVLKWAERFAKIGVDNIKLSDTTGEGNVERIQLLFSEIPNRFPDIHFGAHFHNRYEDSYKKIKAAYDLGCRSFDTAIKGIGGCPMAEDELVGNMPTEQLINFLQKNNIPNRLNLANFESAWNKAKDIFQF